MRSGSCNASNVLVDSRDVLMFASGGAVTVHFRLAQQPAFIVKDSRFSLVGFIIHRGRGRAILAEESAVTIANCSFVDNASNLGGDGGALLVTATTRDSSLFLRLINSTFFANQAKASCTSTENLAFFQPRARGPKSRAHACPWRDAAGHAFQR